MKAAKRSFLQWISSLPGQLATILVLVGAASLIEIGFGISIRLVLWLLAFLFTLWLLGKQIHKRLVYDPQQAWKDREVWERQYRLDAPIMKRKKMNYRYQVERFKDQQQLNTGIWEKVMLAASVGQSTWLTQYTMGLSSEGILRLLYWPLAWIAVLLIWLLILRHVAQNRLNVRMARIDRDVNETFEYLLREELLNA